MIRGLADEMPKPEAHAVPRRSDRREGGTDSPSADHGLLGTSENVGRLTGRRRAPRLSVVVILPANHTLSPERLQDSLRASAGREVDVLVACAGQPTNLSALQRCVGNAQFLLAPSGTSSEALRELAMQHASGDIVTLLPGAALPAADASDRALFKTS